MTGASDNKNPAVYILQGDDSLAVKEFIEGCYANLGEPSLADLNTTHLDGRTCTEEDIKSALYSLPFLAEKRLVILRNPLARYSGEAMQRRFTTLCDGSPDTSLLILVVEDHQATKKVNGQFVDQWEVLKPSHWLMKYKDKTGGRLVCREFALPGQKEMPEWIRKHTKAAGGSITPAAAAALAYLTGNDTNLARMEVEKILLYVGFARAVDVPDVEKLAAPGGQANVFKMLDALAVGSNKEASHLLHTLFEENDPLQIFGLIVTHFRRLLMVREILSEGGGVRQAIQELSLAMFQAEKMVKQAQHYSMASLETIYHRLLEMDENIKSGAIPADLAIESFVMELKVG
ncbi:MAG: DNA polymerase III subunit delta [Anaerolineaceae bacterium]